MAPPKTMAISQQQQQQQVTTGQQGDKQAAKPRKRKGKVNQTVQQNNLENIEPVKSAPAPVVKQPTPAVPSTTTKSTPNKNGSVVPSERTTLKKQQVPTLVKEPVVESRRALPATVTPAVTQASVIGKHQQLGTDEADDIDAGIELDGSSNSGSSVKDMNEDQIKSASVSPIMAQSNLINETCPDITKQVAEVGSIEKLSETLRSTANPAKKISTTKQQLAANQQVIDADEQQLQQKLQNKQRKSTSQDTNTTLEDRSTLKSVGSSAVDRASQGVQPNSDKTNRLRRFSSQSRQDSQDGSMCKVCEQHVYQMERMLAEKSVYHKRCFRCHQCKIQLRVDNYSSHEGQVYCKAHHRQIFQPQVKLDNEDDVDIVAKSSK